MKSVAVIGAGNSGYAIAAHLLSDSVPVNLWNRPKDHCFSRIREDGGIKVSGAINGRFMPRLMTHDIAEAIRGAEVILVTVPAHAHAAIAAELAPSLEAGQIIILTPGRTFGALEVDELLRRAGANPVIVAETQTIIHTCRKDTDTSVIILTFKNDVAVSALDPAHTAEVLEAIPNCLRKFCVPARNTLETSLGNVGMMLHCAPVLFNVGWIESPRTQFKYYYEGITPTVAGFLEKLDAERMTVARACGSKVLSLSDWLRHSYHVTGASLYECIQNNESYAKIDAPQTLRHRYIFEDVPTGLVPLEAVAQAIGVPTPLTRSLIDLATNLLAHDFRALGRGSAALGLTPNLSREEVVQLISGQFSGVPCA
jgi:opine dehydrogenase